MNSNTKSKYYPKKRNKQAISYSGFIVTGIFFFLISIYLFRAFFLFLNKESFPFVDVTYGSIDLPNLFDGVIIRDEKVYKSSSKGFLNFNYSDLDKVKKGALVCTVEDSDAVSKIQLNINEIDSEILNLQDMRREISAFSQDAENTNKKIKEIVDGNIYKFVGTNVSGLKDFKNKVDQKIFIRNQKLLTDYKGSVKDLIDKKDVQVQLLNGNFNRITVENSGILCYIVDNYESIYTIDNMENLDETETSVKIDYTSLDNNKVVNVEDNIFKIVESNEWYIATYIPSQFTYDWKQGMDRRIYIQIQDGFKAVETTIYKIENGEKRDYVIFKISKNILDFMDTRSVKFKVSESEYKGYKIPVTAITERTLLKIPNEYILEEEKSLYVKKLVDGAIEKIEIKVQDKDDEYTYISKNFYTVTIDDDIVSHEDNSKTYKISQIETVTGVYVVNNGYTKFQKVMIDENVPESNGYIILNESTNKNIKLYDRIASDTSSLEEGQKVY